ncbi:hypothetical protein MJO28_014974 [Puccinia striiformis f. sp. tritici]|uniref:PX domain-containing protein n=4 Tax=Puccinia striiformis TaxID=27350 RepID=A0A0L0UX81_9BASI|nr:hypothetical protein Pst134EA_027837 [Puccinia striiformis f. sp. tritici]KAI9615683.1 hypothetical protein KEM48_005561 [Puccinia striiformis f. sp. tritici PST-130]KNE91635.1 hypothetical protein PSTG_14943 [Puccinia striiformis f. sp. tritici PST-78]POW14402.1 hypothetical protein PSHT_07405 [Puccinia striiformis]KAH9442127.1 hypothetical protein Pst134EB_028391 [Puccinia striiformis f. sp. tritici]KAH9448526.1 hypothetical protein Pst134EA_027837 [Puccinia striiformis f. sp. tritici]
MAVMSDRTETFFLSNSSSSLAARKHSAPIGPYQPPGTSSAHDHLYGRGSLLPMPPTYKEGSCWTLASLRCRNPSPQESRPRTISVDVTKVSLRMDGRWAEEKPYTLDKTWEEWVDFRDQLVSRYPEIETILPKLSKGQGFLESIFTISKRSHLAQTPNLKELNSFLTCLVGSCPKKVLNSKIIHAFLQTEEMIVGDHQVAYTDEDIPLCRIPLATEISSHEQAQTISSHLHAFRFPGPTPSQPHPPPHLTRKTSQPNLTSRQMTFSPEVERPTTNEKLSPHSRRRPTLDPMAAIAERPPPPGSIPDLQTGQVTRSGTIVRTLTRPTARLANKPQAPLRPTTGLARPAPVAPPKRPNTSDARLPHEALLRPGMGTTNSRPVCNPVPPIHPRRPSELLRSYSREIEISQPLRPRLREFKSMQDIRATAGIVKAGGRSGRNGLADPARNNSVPVTGETPQLVMQFRSPTNPWERHQRTPSDSSSSFGSSQISPISSVLSSPTITPPTSTISISKSIASHQTRPKLTCRRSVDSLGPGSMRCGGGPSPLGLVPEQETCKIMVHQHVPPAPFYTIPPRLVNPTNPLKINKSVTTCPQSQTRPHTSSGNSNGLKASSLILKVIHLESKTNIILAIQKGLFSLAQIKSKIQNKLKLAAEVELRPNWKIKLTMIDQEEFVRRGNIGEGKGTNRIEDDGLMLLELINRKTKDSQVKKITLRIC